MTKLALCRRCREGHMLPFQRTETFRPPAGAIEVLQLAARCDACGKETVLASQVEENLARLAARKTHYGEYLLGEDIFEFRRQWGLTQRAFSKVFGKGLIAFSLYETEKKFPDLSLTRLLRVAMAHPAIFKKLADTAGVEIPFWNAHCDMERQQKLRLLSVKAPTEAMVYEHRTGQGDLSRTKAPRMSETPQEVSYAEFAFHEHRLSEAA